MPPYADAISQHYAARWAPPVAESRGGTRLPRDFTILLIPRSADTSAYATVCMSQMADPERLELHLFTRAATAPAPAIVELLQAVAQYHRTATPLGLGDSVNFGRPYLPGSRCTRGLISAPAHGGPGLEWLDVPRVRFLWLIPITEAEQRFKTVEGLEALEARFEKAGLDYLDPARPSVV